MLIRSWALIRDNPLTYGYGFVTKYRDGSASLYGIIAEVRREKNGTWFWQVIEGFGHAEPSRELGMAKAENQLKKCQPRISDSITAAYRYRVCNYLEIDKPAEST